MKVRELLEVLLLDQQVVITYVDDGDVKDVKCIAGVLKIGMPNDSILKLEVQVAYISNVDSLLHIITSQ